MLCFTIKVLKVLSWGMCIMSLVLVLSQSFFSQGLRSTVLSTGDTKAREFIHANEEAEVNKIISSDNF